MIKKYLESAPIFELERYKAEPDLNQKNVAFTGAPRKHPYDDEKFILISDPFSSNTIFFEFNQTDVVHVEDLAEIVAEDGSAVKTVRIWIKKQSMGIRYEPFIVEDTLRYMRDSSRKK